ncbi:hypothetical protein MBLNU459_g1317t1 [Dothideomycetes sp. NU459]
MATQSNGGALFSISAAQQPFRLLELPPELLDMLSSANPPTLCLKSPNSLGSTNGAEAVLCTPTKTYQLRQVSTSNTVYVTSSVSAEAGSDSLGEPGVTTISQCDSTLETLAAPPDSARDTLRQMLVRFAEPEDTGRPSPLYLDRITIFAHTPMSEEECRRAWVDFAAFEMDASDGLPKRSYCPTAAGLLRAWNHIRELATLESSRISLAKSMSKNALTNILLNVDQDGECPVELRAAVLRRLAPAQELSQSNFTAWPTQDQVSIDRRTTVQWVGLTMLQARQEDVVNESTMTMKNDTFINEWKDSLPEEWRQDVQLEVLNDAYRISVEGGYMSCTPAIMAGTAAKGAASSGKPSTATAGKRKWHEKFAQARKQGKK